VTTATPTRATFDLQRAKAKSIRDAMGRLTAIVAVTLGGGQLLVIRVLGDRIAKDKALPFEVSMFVAYAVVIGFLIWRMRREVDKARPRCPQCRVALADAAEPVVVSTGKCASCGADYFAPIEMKPAQ
jgi:hypothetical protein